MKVFEEHNYDMETEYRFPSDVIGESYSGYLLLISPSNGNWIVLDNEEQVYIAKQLQKGLSAQRIIEQNPEISIEDLHSVIKEIEGKHFCERMEANDDFVLRIYLTNKCNLRCKHCFMYASTELENEISFEEILEILSLSRKNGCSKVIFTGGEVLLKKEFLDILQYANSLGLYIQVLTNGVLWNDELVNKAALYIDELQVSIDGYDEISNAVVRGAGVYEKALNTVEKFLNYKHIYVSVVTTPLYDTLFLNKDKFIEFGKSLVSRFGVERFLIIFAKELINGRCIKADKEKNEKMTKIIDDIYEKIYPDSALNTFIVNHQYNRIFKNCGYGGLTINSNGDFYFCGRVFDVSCYGNIREISFEKIMMMRKLARRMSYVDNIIPCKECSIRYICGGGCRVANVPEIVCSTLDKREKIFYRECSQENKENIYKLMVESNEFLYW